MFRHRGAHPQGAVRSLLKLHAIMILQNVMVKFNPYPANVQNMVSSYQC